MGLRGWKRDEVERLRRLGVKIREREGMLTENDLKEMTKEEKERNYVACGKTECEYCLMTPCVWDKNRSSGQKEG